jgi:hypothetical protein
VGSSVKQLQGFAAHPPILSAEDLSPVGPLAFAAKLTTQVFHDLMREPVTADANAE